MPPKKQKGGKGKKKHPLDKDYTSDSDGENQPVATAVVKKGKSKNCRFYLISDQV